MSAFGLSRVIALFHAVDDLLEDGPPIAIRVGGGAAMMLHNPSRLTEDVDVFDRVLPPELREAAIRVARSEGIPDSWLNNEVARLGEDGTGFGLDQTPLVLRAAALRLRLRYVRSPSAQTGRA